MKTEFNENSLTILNKLVISYPALKECRLAIESACRCLSDSFSSGKKLLVCGNGGSAADSEHLVGEIANSILSTKVYLNVMHQTGLRVRCQLFLSYRIQRF